MTDKVSMYKAFQNIFNFKDFLYEKNKAILKIVLLILFCHFWILLNQIDTKPISVILDNDSQVEKIIKLKFLDQNKSDQKQIAQTVDSNLKLKPKDPKFLSEKDNMFDRQTMARVVDKFNVGGSVSSQIAKKQEPNKQSKSKQKEKIKNLDLSKLGALSKPTKEFTDRPIEKVKPLNKNQKLASKGKGQGVSSSNDFIKDIPLGDFTKLNSQEYKFYGFYHRIRQKLEQFWGRNIQEEAKRILNRGGRLPASANHITSLVIVLNGNGEIKKVKIKSSSGFRELDSAAIEAFNEAGPFPNPPIDMIKNDQVVLEWGFVVNT